VAGSREGQTQAVVSSSYIKMSLTFFSDTHIAKQVAIQLRTAGVNVVRCQDVGLEDATDKKLMEYAISQKYTLLTKDDDFLVLHNQWVTANREHFGIFYCPYRDKKSIGLIVKTCREYHDLINGGASKNRSRIKNARSFFCWSFKN
jgi:predicted nuclease of predicted toxin-antitoxin system